MSALEVFIILTFISGIVLRTKSTLFLPMSNLAASVATLPNLFPCASNTCSIGLFYEFYYCHLATIRESPAGLYNSRVASSPLFILFAQFIYHFLCSILANQSGERSSYANSSFLAICYHLFYKWSYLFCFWFCGLNSFMQNKRTGKRIEQSFSYFANSAEFSVCIVVSHLRISNLL